MTQLTDAVPMAAKAVDRLPQDIARERQAVYADLRSGEPLVNNLFAKYRTAVADTAAHTSNVRGIASDINSLLKQVNLASAALNDSMLTADKVFLAPGRNAPKDPNVKPFDINEYTQSAVQFTAALRKANQMLLQTGQLLQSPAFLKPVNEVALTAADTSSKVLDAAFWRGLALIVIFFHHAYALSLGDREAEHSPKSVGIDDAMLCNRLRSVVCGVNHGPSIGARRFHETGFVPRFASCREEG